MAPSRGRRHRWSPDDHRNWAVRPPESYRSGCRPAWEFRLRARGLWRGATQWWQREKPLIDPNAYLPPGSVFDGWQARLADKDEYLTEFAWRRDVATP